MIKVLIVDDSQTTLEYLKYLLSLDKEIVITGIANNGKEAVELSQRKPPDVILMDIHMPQMDGFEATRIIMEKNPAPIVIMSASHNVKDTDVIFRAMEAGAVALANKPKGLDHPDHESSVKELVQTVKLMAEIKVVRRHPIAKRKPERTCAKAGITIRKARGQSRRHQSDRHGCVSGRTSRAPCDSLRNSSKISRSPVDCSAHCLRLYGGFDRMAQSDDGLPDSPGHS